MPPAKLLTLVLAVIIFVVSYRVLDTVVGPLVAAWRLGPQDQERPTTEVSGWGAALDPAGDCLIKSAGESLAIDVPGTLHDLSVERAGMTSPRVLRQVDGDFVAEVTVPGRVVPEGGQASTYAAPYHGAGLLIWLDRCNYIRLERAAILRNNNAFHYINFEQRTNANMTSSAGTGVAAGPLALRLERRGSRVSAAYRLEGQGWVRLPKALGIRRWGESLKVGVAAVNTATDPFVAEFRDLRVGPLPD